MTNELVNYPFKIDNEENLILYRVNDDFEMRFTRELSAKRVVSTCKKDCKKYIEIEIDDDRNVKIIEVFDKINVFKTPADFYVPISEDSKYFYESMHLSLINENLDTFLEKALEINEIVKNGGFPEFPIPITTVSSHFENFESATAKSDELFVISTIQIKYSDEIPVEPATESNNIARSFLTPEQYQIQNDFYTAYFNLNNISRFKTIANFYERKEIDFKRLISLHVLKKCIGLHAYFLTSGPWRKCWVKLGYDPKSDSENYKYQVIEMRSKKTNFQIFQKPEIIMEVSEHLDWYISKECDPIDGFISKALKNFIVYIIDNGGDKLIDKKIEDLQDSDMEIFDM